MVVSRFIVPSLVLSIQPFFAFEGGEDDLDFAADAVSLLQTAKRHHKADVNALAAAQSPHVITPDSGFLNLVGRYVVGGEIFHDRENCRKYKKYI